MMHLVLKQKGKAYQVYLRNLQSEKLVDKGPDLHTLLKRWMDYPVKLRIK
jgi:hypothetical protein